MTNSYGMVNQPQQNYIDYSMMQQPRQGGSGVGVFGAATLGFLGGGTIGYFKHRRPVKNGVVTDTFAQKSFDRYIDKGLEQSKKDFYTQAKNIMKKIDKVDTPEKLKALLNSNNAVNKHAFPGFSLDEFCRVLTSSNLTANKNKLKNALDMVYSKDIETMRSHIGLCWDAEKKKLVKVPEVGEKAFKAIKDTASKMKWNKALKYGGIGAAICGGLVLVYKSVVALLTKQAQKRQMEAMQNAYAEQQQLQNAQSQQNMQQQTMSMQQQVPQQTMVA